MRRPCRIYPPKWSPPPGCSWMAIWTRLNRWCEPICCGMAIMSKRCGCAPAYRVARREYAGVLAELHRYADARREPDALLEEEPDNQDLTTLYAFCCAGMGEHERAVELYRGLLQGAPADVELHLSIAHALKTLGQREEAIESYRRAALCRPDFGDAYWSLANLKTYQFTDEELSRIRAAESAPATGLIDRYHLNFALGKAFEDRGEYGESFRHYERGNALKRAESK